MIGSLQVMQCPECKGNGIVEDVSWDGGATYKKCSYCDGMRFVAVNVEHLKQI